MIHFIVILVIAFMILPVISNGAPELAGSMILMRIKSQCNCRQIVTYGRDSSFYLGKVEIW